jgi:formate dehydrogenase maturation protein FdhE
MPLFKCSKCHHEWEGTVNKCDWCGSDGHILQEKTSLEMAIEEIVNNKDFWSDFGAE